MHVLSTWNAPSAVYFSAKLGPTTLVIAKAARIEVVRLLDDGLRHVCGVDLWGQITSLNTLDNDVSLNLMLQSKGLIVCSVPLSCLCISDRCHSSDY